MNVIAHNLLAMNAQRNFGITSNKRAKATEKLSSGFRINRAADDAAGLSISEKMRRQIRGLTQGVQNTQEGISLCQVADGALAEVNDMLHRITELSVKAATGTQTNQDRQYIQQEITQILEEIDRIGKETKFNDQHIFRGAQDIVYNPDGSVSTMQDIEFGDLILVDVGAGKTPLVNGQNMDMHHFQAIVADPTLALDGHAFNMIYGSGSTSNTSFRVTDTQGNQTIVKIDDQSVVVSDFQADTANGVWSRKATYTGPNGEQLVMTQNVRLATPSDTEKNYVITYEFDKSADIEKVEFAFHTDTAYNNNDVCEGYFIGGQRVDKTCMYTQAGSPVTDGKTHDNLYEGNIPDSFSIVDVDKALTFSEKISFNGTKPNTVSLGIYNQIDQWAYYDELDIRLGNNAIRQDMGFTLYYDLGDLTNGNTISFNYGIASVESDPNLQGVTLTPNTDLMQNHDETLSVWIQSGVEPGDGMFVTIEEMNTDVLGIKGIDLSTVDGANAANVAVKTALKNVSSNRAVIGAQQNRLEHIVANEENIIENTTAAESQIRDTDMAKLMVEYSNLGILEQAGQAMMAQANQSNAGILTLLQ